MCIKNIGSKIKKYKFFKLNLWGRLFVLKRFKGRRVIYAKINRRHTLRKIRVNAIKLRRKSHTVKGQGLLAAFRIKNFYLSLSDHKLKNYIKKARSLPSYKIFETLTKKPLRIEDNLVALLEFRVENILNRLGVFSVHQIRQLLSHRKILVNSQVVTRGSVALSPGDIVTFKGKFLKRFLLKKLLTFKKIGKKTNKKYIAKKKYPMLLPFLLANKLNYFSFSFKTVSILIGNHPRFSEAYYPFPVDIKKLILIYNNV